MNTQIGLPDHIEDYLASLHNGHWFEWSDPFNKVYANLSLINTAYTLPTEQECNDGLAALIAETNANKQAFETNKASALAKLSALGLTADEIKVLLTP